MIRLVLPTFLGALLIPTAGLPGPAPGVVPPAARPVSALSRDRILELPPGRNEYRVHWMPTPSREGELGFLKIRLEVRDPDAALLGLSLGCDGLAPILVDGHGEADGRRPLGFADEGPGPFVVVPAAARTGPHRLTLLARPRAGARADRFTVCLRLVGAQVYDPVALFAGLRDLSDVLARRYRDLRDYDLAVRRRDPKGRGEPVAHRADLHFGETERALYVEAGGSHLRLVNGLTFRARQERVDPERYLGEGMALWARCFTPWLAAPSGGRMSLLYAAQPQLYEYLDEASAALGGLREAYYELAGLTEAAAGDPLERAGPALTAARRRLENVIEIAARIHGAIEARAEFAAGLPDVVQDFPRVDRFIQGWQLDDRPPVERRHLAEADPVPGTVRGAGVAEGHPVRLDPVALRVPRDVRRDRYAAERVHLADYLDAIRALAQHDLRLVRMWSALFEVGTPAAGAGHPPSWRPSGLAKLGRGEDAP